MGRWEDGCNTLQMQCNSNRNYWKRNRRMQGVGSRRDKTSVGGFGFRDNNGLKFEPYDGEGQGDYGDNMVEE